MSDLQKLIMKKFLRIIHFINQYHNKILHNQIKSKTKKLIKEIQKKDKDFPVFPDFNFKNFWKVSNILLKILQVTKKFKLFFMMHMKAILQIKI